MPEVRKNGDRAGTARAARGCSSSSGKVDLLLGFWLVIGFAVPPTFGRVATSLIAVAGYLAGMRPTAR